MRRRGVFLAVGGALAGLSVLGAGEASESVRFRDAERLAAYFDNAPGAAVAALEGILTQEQADALEGRLFPEATNAEKRAAYERIRIELTRLGLAADDAIVRGIEERVATLRDAGANR